MWLLDTHTLKLHYFVSPEAVEEGYMILSHVWDESKEPEMSFQDIQRIHERCTTSGEDPHDLVNTKIRKYCELGERHGYKWAWIDTCCIDKTSSAELMETINAMYQYYALCLVCYVYLPDFWYKDRPEQVKFNLHDTRFDPHKEPLIKNRWQRRGWTLQELIAPRVVHFLSSHWALLGTKTDLADGLELGLGIPASVLRHEQSPLEFSVAERMSWAANRKTTRVEDEAYCLLGLFGIKMPTLYGEGSKAFQRLQEEILNQTADSTVFAWGTSASLDSLREYPDYAGTGLLASGPSDFGSSRGLQVGKSSNSLHHRIVFRPTPHGPILARIPLLYINGQVLGDFSWRQGGTHLVLVLKKCGRTSHLPFPMYDIGFYDTRDAPRVSILRIATLETLQGGSSSPATHVNYHTALHTILLLRHGPQIKPREPIYLPLNHSFRPSICIPEHLIHSLLHRWVVAKASITNAGLPWLGNPPLVIAFHHRAIHDADDLYAVVLVGRCTSHSTNGAESGSFWATFRGSSSRCTQEDYSHQCPEDHLLYWPDLKKCFVLEFHVAGDQMDGHIAKWLFNIAFTSSVTRGALIMTHITLDYRLLLQVCDYVEIEEEWTMTPVDTDVDRQHSRHAPSISALDNALNQAALCTKVIDSEEIASFDKDRQSAVDASHNRPLCYGFPLDPSLGKYFKNPLAALNVGFLISEFIRYGAFLTSNLDASLTYESLPFKYSATLNGGPYSEGFTLLLP